MIQPRRASDKVYRIDELLRLRDDARAAGRIVVWTNGCFDVLHSGHVRNLEAARSLGDLLIVGVNSDAAVRQLKGADRPVVAEEERCELVAALACVDAAIVFDELVPLTIIAAVRPDIHVKGADYAPPHGKPIPEATVVESYGGRVEFLPLVPGRSTSDLIQRIQQLSDASARLNSAGGGW